MILVRRLRNQGQAQVRASTEIHTSRVFAYDEPVKWEWVLASDETRRPEQPRPEIKVEDSTKDDRK